VPEGASIRSRLADVRERIARAAGRAKRDPGSVRLVAISKTFPADAVRAAADLGQLDFGENKVQEALLKMDSTSDLPLRWHLVGHLQSNKVKKAGSRFDVVHSIDQAPLVGKLDDAALAAERRIDWLVQVDLAHEPTKHGARIDDLMTIFERASSCHASRVIGLMLIPPAVEDPEKARPFFRALRDLRSDLQERGVDPTRLTELSMGMSHDFEVAIEEGATLVRVGSAIFGMRAAPLSIVPSRADRG
jgi:pyridoxal phosphate enzyme (YggS family)